jgi:conjugative relaxase-like TrwC/TraI family protein
MLAIGKLSAASVDYYTEQLSHSVGEDVPVLRGGDPDRRVDYYADHRAPARWMGSGLEAAGVDPRSPVTKEAFALLMGHETLTGESMTRPHAAHGCVAAFDHTLSAPKSVSLLYAFGDGPVRAEVRAAHLEAVREAVNYMEAHCAEARVGTRWRDDDGWHTTTRNVDSDGFVAAAFDHFTSRANDPQLHTHVVVINRVHTGDGWRALDARRNYLHAKAGGTIYETVLRDELTRRLGVSWQPVVNGIADIEGFSPELLEHFSTRRAEILEAAEAYAARNGGRIHARMLQKFTLETRQPKQHPRGERPVTQEMRDYGVGADVVAHWRRRAEAAPQDLTEVVSAVVQGGRESVRPVLWNLKDAAEWIVVEVTDRQPVFTRRDLLSHISSWFPEGATRADLTNAADQVLEVAIERGEAISLTNHTPDGRWTLPDEPRYTTRTQVDRERAVLNAVRRSSRVQVDWEALDRAARVRELTSAQTLAVQSLAHLDGRIVAVAGPGGSGKTYAIGAYAEGLHHAGHHVIGVAPTASAAQKLSQDLGAQWTGTIAMLTHHLDQRGETLPSGTVIICDEASMISTKDLARLAGIVEGADGKLILLGDPQQLPSIDSGGLFHRIVADGHGVVTDLAGVNQRQRNDLDRNALHQLRTGGADRAVLGYTEAGRVHIGHDRVDTMSELVDAWWNDARTTGVESVRMLAARRYDVEGLNELARSRVRAEGLLSGPSLETRSGLSLQAGDRIVVRTNWYAHADLRNGQTGTVTTVDPGTGQLTFRRDHDRVEVVLPRRYVNQSVDYGYAQTIHTAQGRTYERVHVYVDPTMTAEHGYTGLSRAKDETHLWMADPPGPLGECGHAGCRPELVSRTDTLVRQFSRSGVRPAATMPEADWHVLTDHQLIARRNELARTIREDSLDLPTQAPGGKRGGVDAHLIAEYEQIGGEIDRRVTARALLYRTEPPADLLEQIGARSEALDPQAWDAAVAVYARTRVEVGPEADLTDPAVLHTGQWRDAVHALNLFEEPALTLKLTG